MKPNMHLIYSPGNILIHSPRSLLTSLPLKKMNLSLFCLFLLVLTVDGLYLDVCKNPVCGTNGPPIRFPFRLMEQPKQCGYYGFDLSCTEKGETVLELPNAVKLYIQNIDYRRQLVSTYDPDGCLARHARNFSLLSSPFQFPEMTSQYALFNCSLADRDRYSPVQCLNSPGYQVYYFDSYASISSLPLTNCTKMYNTSELPENLFSPNLLPLNWTQPNCGRCEARNELCGFNNNGTGSGIDCYPRPKTHESKLRKLAIAGIVVGSTLLLIVLLALLHLYRIDRRERVNRKRIEKFLGDYKALKPARYMYSDLKRITGDFKDKLGEGAFGTVYKGRLSSEIFVAVKILNNSTGNGEEFINEVGTMGRIHHVNVVRLVGFCADGFRRALIYEFLPNESLEKFIFSGDGKHPGLGWEKLQEIAVGIARGIEYLHQGCDQRILHFDIKPHNILLDESFTPKISDFGLAKLCAKDQSAVSMTAARGTMGYIAPEVFSRNFGSVSYKSDVYSFGMLLLEMVGGRKNIEGDKDKTNQVYFPEWIYKHLDLGEELRIRIEEEGDAKIARKLTIIGLWCIQWYPVDRPPMKAVVHMLDGEGDGLAMPPNPFASNGGKMDGMLPGRRLHPELEVISEE